MHILACAIKVVAGLRVEVHNTQFFAVSLSWSTSCQITANEALFFSRMLVWLEMMWRASSEVTWWIHLILRPVVHLVERNLLERPIIHLLLHLFTFLICSFGQLLGIYLSVRILWIFLIKLNPIYLIKLFIYHIRISLLRKLLARYEEFLEFRRKDVFAVFNSYGSRYLTLATLIAVSLCQSLKKPLSHYHWVFLFMIN